MRSVVQGTGVPVAQRTPSRIRRAQRSVLGGDPNRRCIVSRSMNTPSPALAATKTPAETEVLQGALLAGKVQWVREQWVNVPLALLLLVRLLLAQCVDRLDRVLDRTQAVVDVLPRSQWYTRVGSGSGNRRGFLVGMIKYFTVFYVFQWAALTLIRRLPKASRPSVLLA